MTDIDPTPINPDPSNVIPPTELDRRRRVLAATEQLADLGKDAMERIRELRELDVPAADWVPLVLAHAPPMVQGIYERYGTFLTSAFDGFFDAVGAGAKTSTEGILAAMGGAFRRDQRNVTADLEAPHTVQMPTNLGDEEFHSFEGLRMRRLIERLFAQAPKLTDASGKPDPAQAPALECHVMLKAGGAIVGSLSVTPEGTLRMLSPNQTQTKGRADAKPVMIEHFFDYEQVADIAVFREVSGSAGSGSGIITS